MQGEAHTPASGSFESIIVARRCFCVSKKVRPLKAMPASKQAYKKRAERLSFCMPNRKRYEVTCDSDRPEWAEINLEFQYRKRYEVTCDVKDTICLLKSIDVSIPQAV